MMMGVGVGVRVGQLMFMPACILGRSFLLQRKMALKVLMISLLVLMLKSTAANKK